MKRLCVIGAGPAGLIASAFAAESCAVDLYDRNEKTGKKLYLTGKGRCNITNTASMDEFIKCIPRNPRFMYSSLDGFFNDDIISLIESQGVPTKVERGGRVFPASDKSSDVIRALTGFARNRGVDIVLNSKVEFVSKTDNGFCIGFAGGVVIEYDCVVIATGGKSYPSTGSTGDGYRFAESLGHTINEPKPSLVPLITEEDWVCRLAGLSLKNVVLSAYSGRKKLFSDIGEMLFTHTGISGPLVLSLSALIADEPHGIRLAIDMKPALDIETLDTRILRDLEANKHKRISNAIARLLPQRMIPILLELAGVDAEKTTDNLSKVERRSIVETLKAIPLTVRAAASMDEAVITRGGVSVKEIDPKTMESKLVKGLYFAGEVIDVDALTGGYNLQLAYSTAAAAGRAIALKNRIGGTCDEP